MSGRAIVTTTAPRHRYRELRLPATTLRFRPVVVGAVAALALAVLALTIVHLGVGESRLALSTVADALLGRGDPGDRFVVTELRLPRPLVAAAAGCAFGASGALLQRISRNDLASPDLLGVTAGANLGIAILAFGLPDQAVTWRLPAAALGGLVVGGLVIATAGWGRGPTGRVLVVGAGVSFVAQAVVAAIVAGGSLVFASRIVLWTIGGLYGRSWNELNLLLNAQWVLLPAAFLLARHVDHLDGGDDLAVSLGVPVGRVRASTVLVAGGLAIVAVAAVGPIGFVGLVAPHLARRVVGDATTAGLVAVSAAAGALVLVAADLAARTVVAPREIPTGALVPLVGIPLLLILLTRRPA